MPTIEDIVLQKDGRNMTALRPHLPDNFVTEAAELVLEHPGKAFIISGFYIITADAPETDGPPGAAGIGEALAQLGYEVVYITDQWSGAAMRSIAGSHRVVEFPMGDHRASAEFAHNLLAEESPSVVISIERAGLVGDGTYRNFRQVDISAYNARIDHLLDMHPYSVGIGDGGNEIGMGNLRDVIAVTDQLPDDPCVTTVTKLIIASTSNWGGYGLAAALSVLKGRNLLPSVEAENGWVQATVDAGAVEGMSGRAVPEVDGFTLADYNSCLADLHDHVNAALG